MSSVLAAVVAAASLIVPPTPSGVAVPQCRGLPATIVRTPHVGIIDGTEGPDVIVTDGAAFVYARGGDDVICATGSKLHRDTGIGVQVSGGTGDDVVDTTGDTDTPTETFLGPGDDLFIGGGQRDIVRDDSAPFTDPGTDVVRTGGGDDVYYASSNTSIDGTFDGQAGEDTLVADPTRFGHWVFDNRTHQAFKGSVVMFRWASFERLDLSLGGAGATTRFIGGPADDVVVLHQIAGAHMGGGDDEVWLLEPRSPEVGAVLDGGPGRDLIHVSGFVWALRRASVDLQARTVTAGAGASDITVPLRAFEDARVLARAASVRGDGRANRITWAGCVVRVRGGAGDDRVRWARTRDVGCARRGHDIVVHGNLGDDRLSGSDFADRLVGDAGRDVALGGRGRDRCSAEVRLACELSGP